MLKHAFFGSASRGANSAACLLLLLLGITEFTLLLAFTLFIAHNNPKLDNFQNAIIDPIGIRWIVAITVMGGCLFILAYIQMWLMQASRARGKKRRGDDFELGDVWHDQSQLRQSRKQQKQLKNTQRKSNAQQGPGSYFQGWQSQGEQDQSEPHFGAIFENLQTSSSRLGRVPSFKSESNCSWREASPASRRPDLLGGSRDRLSSPAPDRAPSYKTIRSLPKTPQPAYREDKFYQH